MNKIVNLKGAAERGPVHADNTETIFLQLSERWALGNDSLQWIVYRWKGSSKGWRPISFVASNKGVLVRVINEHGIILTPEAKAILASFPEAFRDWLTASKPPKNLTIENLENNPAGEFPEPLTGREPARFSANQKRTKVRI